MKYAMLRAAVEEKQSMAKALKIRPNRPVPPTPEKIKWDRVSEVQIFVSLLSPETKQFLEYANQKAKKVLSAMTPEACAAMDRFMT